MSKVDEIKAALLALLNRDQRNTCHHEETHRGGAIWEICNSCGAKWADDEGGKPEWVDPPEWAAGYAAIEAIEALAQPAGEADPLPCAEISEIGENVGVVLWIPFIGNPLSIGQKLYTTPQQSQPLTDEQIQDMLKIGNPTVEQYELIRLGWNEAHGIKKGGTE